MSVSNSLLIPVAALLFCSFTPLAVNAQSVAESSDSTGRTTPGSVKADNSTADSRTSDRATMVIMAPAGPVFADVRLSVAKAPYRTWVGKFLAQQLDTDKSGTLNAKELALLTQNIRKVGQISGPDEILKSMSADAAGEVPARDFAEWLRLRLPKAFDLIAQPQSSDDAVRLSSLIDIDQNAAISDDELQNAFRTMRFRDLDNDETFSVSELLPYRDPLSQNAAVTPDVVNLPFFHVTDDQSRRITAERLLKRYGDGLQIPAAKLRQSQTPQTSADLDLAAVDSLLASPEHHLVIEVKLSDRANTSDIDVTVADAAASFCRVTDDSFGQTMVVVDGLPLKIVARGGGANNRAATRGFLGQTFVMLDSDRNQYLDETEFAGLLPALQQAGATGTFADVDINADKMVTRDEIFSFVERDQMATASRIEVTVKQDGKTLFGLLDANQDRRLSAREVRTGTSVLQKYDGTGDGVFAETELGTEYVLTFGLGRSELRRAGGSMQMMNPAGMRSGDAILPGTAGLSGPEWFRRMDRNQDGDVSRREFLGTADHFRTIDSNADLLISADEADALAATASE